ncbi:MAG: hypothetical protein RBT72_08360, partial [Spirochaetia bacterium]|nr:hypothetical protein [Spirochaetia bacterium]
LLRALRLSPSAFLEAFCPPKGWETLGHSQIEALQCSYVEKVFTARGKTALLPAALDLIRFNGALSRALAEGTRSIVELSYSHNDLEGPGILSLAAFVKQRPKSPCSVEILAGKEGPLVRSPKKRRGQGDVTPSPAVSAGPPAPSVR